MTILTADDVRRFLLDRFSTMLAENGINVGDIDEDFDLLKAGVVDSFGVVEMIASVEQYFNITVDFESMDPAELTVLGSFSRYVAENAGKSL